jgi:hypothetical protein
LKGVTRQQAEQITQYVNDCSIWRLTAQETAEYLTTKGFPIDIRTVKRYRARIRASASKWIDTLAKSKRADYIATFKERIEEIHAYQRELWLICNNRTTHPRTRVEAIAKLMDCTLKLTDLYERVPILTAIRQSDTAVLPHQEQQSEKELT